MKSGSIVTVYLDPLYRTQAEGKAQLVRDLGQTGTYRNYPVHQWEVRFITNGRYENETFCRIIYHKPENPI